MVCLFVCLFVWGLSFHSRIFQSFGDVTITGEGLQILTYTRHSRPLSSGGSLACHSYCETGHLWSCHYLFLQLRSVAAEFIHPTFRLRCQRSNPLLHRRGGHGLRMSAKDSSHLDTTWDKEAWNTSYHLEENHGNRAFKTKIYCAVGRQ